MKGEVNLKRLRTTGIVRYYNFVRFYKTAGDLYYTYIFKRSIRSAVLFCRCHGSLVVTFGTNLYFSLSFFFA